MAGLRIVGYLLPALLVNLLLVAFIHRIVNGEPSAQVLITGTQRVKLLTTGVPANTPRPADDIEPLTATPAAQQAEKPAFDPAVTVEVPNPRFEPRELPPVPLETPTELGDRPYLGAYNKRQSRAPSPATEDTGRTALQRTAAATEESPGSTGPTSLKPRHRAPPAYPRKAKRSGLEGVVTVAFTVATDGSVQDPEILTARPPDVFDRAVLRSVRDWRFDPLPKAQRVVQDVTFRLTED